MTTIHGSIAVVTGGQRGLGKAFVQELLELGATKVYATARTPKPSDDPRVVPLALDVNDPASVAALVEQTQDVTVVVNNAGTFTPTSIAGSSIEELKLDFETNVWGAVRVAQAYAPVLKANGGGALIDIHSALSWVGGFGAYGASKAALWSITNSLRIELTPQGTQVVGVHLGYTDTDMVAEITDVEKNDPRQVARDTLLATEKGQAEVLADAASTYFKGILSGPVEGLAIG